MTRARGSDRVEEEEKEKESSAKMASIFKIIEDLILMMNLVAYHVAENANWLDTADELKNWGEPVLVRGGLGGPISFVGNRQGEVQ